MDLQGQKWKGNNIIVKNKIQIFYLKIELVRKFPSNIP